MDTICAQPADRVAHRACPEDRPIKTKATNGRMTRRVREKAMGIESPGRLTDDEREKAGRAWEIVSPRFESFYRSIPRSAEVIEMLFVDNILNFITSHDVSDDGISDWAFGMLGIAILKSRDCDHVVPRKRKDRWRTWTAMPIDPDTNEDPVPPPDFPDLFAELAEAVEDLPVGFRGFVQLRLEGYSVVEIASALGITTKVAKNVSREAVGRLRAHFGIETPGNTPDPFNGRGCAPGCAARGASKVVPPPGPVAPPELAWAIESLPAKLQDVMALRFQGALLREVASHLGISLSTAKTHSKLAIKKLKVHFAGREFSAEVTPWLNWLFRSAGLA